VPPLSPEEYGAGRQIERDGDTLDVLGVIVDGSGQQFVIITTEDMGGLAGLVPASALRDDESTFAAVDPSEREERRRQEEEDRLAKEEQDRKDFAEWQAEQNRQQEGQSQV